MICFYSAAAHLGGAERSLLDLAKGLAKDGDPQLQPWILLPKSQGPLVDELAGSNLEHSVLPMPRLFLKLSRQKPVRYFFGILLLIPTMTIYFLKLCQILKKHNPQIIYTSGLKCHVLGVLAGAVLSKPVVCHLRDILPHGPTRLILQGLLKLFRARIVANSKATAQAFSKTPITVVYNGLDENIYTARRTDTIRRRFQLSPDIPVIGIIGVLARWKGQIEFLKMARHMIDNKMRAHFVIVGSEIYDTEGERGFTEILKREAQTLGLEGKVHFLEFQKNITDVMGGLDILVHGSIKPEPFGRVIIEAFACKVPVAASADGGVLELVTNLNTGLLFKPGDCVQMAEKVSQLISDSQLRTKLINNGHKIFLQDFTQKRYVDEMTALFRSHV